MSSHHHHSNPEFGHLLNSSNHNNSSANSNNNNHHHHHTTSDPQNGEETKPKKIPPPNGKKTKGRVKIKMEFIDNKLRRYTTFSKRKTGIMKKAYELSTLTGTQVMLLVASETGHVYTFATRKLQPMITSEAGKALIQTCLNSPDPPNSGSDSQRMSATGYEETELTYAADPNASEPEEDGGMKDSEGSCSGSEDSKDVPGLLPLSNGMVPANFAALLASATAAGLGVKGMTIDNLMQQQQHQQQQQQQQQQQGSHLSSRMGQSSGSSSAAFPSLTAQQQNSLMSNYSKSPKKQKRDSHKD